MLKLGIAHKKWEKIRFFKTWKDGEEETWAAQGEEEKLTWSNQSELVVLQDLSN